MTALTGSFVTPTAALRAASAAPLAAWPACPPTLPTIAPNPAPTLLTPCCTQFPNASTKPWGSDCGRGSAGTDDGTSGPGVCAAAETHTHTKTQSASKHGVTRVRRRASSGLPRHAQLCTSALILIGGSDVLVSSYGHLTAPDHVNRHSFRIGRLRQKCRREGPPHLARTRSRGAFQ